MPNADAILAQTRGFMKSRVILTAAELDFFTRLDEKPCSAEKLARDLGVDTRAATRLLDCLVTLELLRKDGGVYTLTEDGTFYSARHPESVLPMALHMNSLWGTWSDLTETVRKGGHPERKSGVIFTEDDLKAFIGAMHVVGREMSKTIAEACDLGRFKQLLDIGGASGTYTIAFLRENPAMTAVIFDTANVIPMAKERLTDEGILDRVDLVPGDFYVDELPTGCDLALLSAIIHQNSPEENLALYKKIFAALDAGGTVIIRDHIMDDSRANPPSGAMFAINMLVNTRGGDTYTFREIKDELQQAGFTDVRQVRQGMGMDGLVEARKSA
jgi:hypothetical protein